MVADSTENDRGPHMPPPMFTCICGLYFLDMFAFREHFEECETRVLPPGVSHD